MMLTIPIRQELGSAFTKNAFLHSFFNHIKSFLTVYALHETSKANPLELSKDVKKVNNFFEFFSGKADYLLDAIL